MKSKFKKKNALQRLGTRNAIILTNINYTLLYCHHPL